MSRSFTGTNVINFGHGSALNNVVPYSFCCWIFPNSAGGGNLGRIFDKGSSNQKFWCLTQATSNAIRLRQDRATTNADAVSAANTVTMSAWAFFGCTYSDTNGAKIFKGTPDGLVAEVSYASNTVGSGAAKDDSTSDLNVGNSSAGVRNFDGSIAEFMGMSGELTAKQFTQIMYGGFAVKPFIYAPFYGDASPEPDFSGSAQNGTVTGASSAKPPPSFRGRFGFTAGWRGNYTAAAVVQRQQTLSLLGVGC